MPPQLTQAIVESTGQATSCEVGGETVILDVASGQYFALNSVGGAIWSHLQTPSTVAEICRKMCSDYDVPADRCEAEVSALLQQLATHGLVRIHS